MTRTLFGERILYGALRTEVFDGGRIPAQGVAIHDGDLYFDGERVGRVLTIEQGIGFAADTIRFLTADPDCQVGYRTETA